MSVQRSGSRVQGPVVKFRVQGSGFRVEGERFGAGPAFSFSHMAATLPTMLAVAEVAAPAEVATGAEVAADVEVIAGVPVCGPSESGVNAIQSLIFTSKLYYSVRSYY
jgi:hypothetical protein